MNVQQIQWITAQRVCRYCIRVLCCANIRFSNQEMWWAASVSFILEATGRVSVSLPQLHYQANGCAFVMSEQHRGCWLKLLDYHEHPVSCSREDLPHVRIKNITKQSLCYEYPNKAAGQSTQGENPLWGIFHSHRYAAWICITSLMVMVTLRHTQPSPAQQSKTKRRSWKRSFFLASRAPFLS